VTNWLVGKAPQEPRQGMAARGQVTEPQRPRRVRCSAIGAQGSVVVGPLRGLPVYLRVTDQRGEWGSKKR
jgi:hypothetical protein